MSTTFELVLVGATGFVGQIVCRYLLEHRAVEDFRWAIAGRSADKLMALKNSLGSAAQDLELLVVDITDAAQAQALCEKTKVIMTTAGPYALYGEMLVKTCAMTGTDYCDLTGEVQWIRRMLDRYEAIAQDSGARIVHCCGFDSIPSDLGVFYLQQQAQKQFGEYCTTVKMRLKDIRGGISGGTLASGINLLQEAIADPALKTALGNPYILCDGAEAQRNHPATLMPVQIDYSFGEWLTPFVMAGINVPIVLRSNALQGWQYGQDFRYSEAILTGTNVSGCLKAYGLKFALDVFVGAAAIAPNLLKKFIPAPGEGPSETEQEQGFYDLRFWGETASGKTMVIQVTGDRDPGYGSTAKLLAQAGLCLAKDITDQKGGFWTPASLCQEHLIQRLSQFAGLTFQPL
ncbi:trans-acting enoyl reductase family protein [Picosynechococcus sp. NKBG15041c]|uniref:saccharopine dehydrogenase family protein n=1 Tax=Picosynechococcus sp. NKBG15041c TaxID=1407650 RepID=UPI00041DB160|nr:saccharopine dehydrogenase NADP-binding domain-containing protein [Picosynechococcus sp. NKBG15041c]